MYLNFEAQLKGHSYGCHCIGGEHHHQSKYEREGYGHSLECFQNILEPFIKCLFNLDVQGIVHNFETILSIVFSFFSFS